MFENSMSQSNPIFGKIVYRTDERKMAKKGFKTPISAVLLTNIDKDTHEFIDYSSESVEIKAKHFLITLKQAIEDLDIRIKQDSKGRRRAFLFVTVRGNIYLKQIRNNKKFNAWLIENNIGVYMTSSFISNNKEVEYNGGGQIKKSTSNSWVDKNFSIGDFTDIINGCSNKFKELNLTKDDIENHINILVNIDQCNTGINLPALNGVYISRLLDKNNPLSLQIPGRCSRPDNDDVMNINKWNKENKDFEVTEKCDLIKPNSYIYFSLDEFSREEQLQCNDVLCMIYQNEYLKKVTLPEKMIGVGSKLNVDNSNKDITLDEIPTSIKALTNKFEGHSLLLNLFNAKWTNSNEIELEIYKNFEALKNEKRNEGRKLLNIDYQPSKIELISINEKLKKLN